MTALRGNTTIVTEHRTYTVDSVSRKGLNRSVVSAKSNDISENTVVVSRTKPAIIDGFEKFLKIDTTFPVLAEFITTGLHNSVTVDETPNAFVTGVLFAEDVHMNEDLSVVLHDPDLHSPNIDITVFNVTTGETESLTLFRSEKDDTMYMNTIKIVPSKTKGVDFNGTMAAAPGNVIRLIYNDARGNHGKPQSVVKDINVIARMSEPTMFVRGYISVDGTIDVAIRNTVPGATLNVHYNDTIQTLASPSGTLFTGRYTLTETVEVGQSLEVHYTFEDEFTEHDLLVEYVEVVDVMPQPDLLTHISGSKLTVLVSDSNLESNRTNIIAISAAGVSTVVANSIGNTGVYEAEIELIPEHGETLTLRYVANRSGKLSLIESTVELPEQEQVQPTIPEEPIVDEQLPGSVKMVINGLFTLNGSFKGYIKLTPVENEDVRCSVIRAN